MHFNWLMSNKPLAWQIRRSWRSTNLLSSEKFSDTLFLTLAPYEKIKSLNGITLRFSDCRKIRRMEKRETEHHVSVSKTTATKLFASWACVGLADCAVLSWPTHGIHFQNVNRNNPILQIIENIWYLNSYHILINHLSKIRHKRKPGLIYIQHILQKQLFWTQATFPLYKVLALNSITSQTDLSFPTITANRSAGYHEIT